MWSKKNVYKLVKHRFATTKKTVHEIETLRLAAKENVSGTAVNKEGHADCLLEIKMKSF